MGKMSPGSQNKNMVCLEFAYILPTLAEEVTGRRNRRTLALQFSVHDPGMSGHG